ncbi:MAG: hypothetical protein HKN12_01830, partial [Gemmatimonadetes bacterium]|nr:hypothetical protein [Gemmatimonadota bacterium]
MIATGRISGALDRLQNPGVQQSVEHAPRLYREITDRWRNTAEPLLAALPGEFPPPSSEAVIRRLLQESSLAYAAWETDDGGVQVVAAADVEPDDVPSADDWEMLHGDGSPPTLRGRTLRFFRPEGGRGNAAVVGVILDPDLASAMESVSRNYARYLQLGPMEAVQKQVVWFSSIAIFLLAVIAAFFISRATARRIS